MWLSQHYSPLHLVSLASGLYFYMTSQLERFNVAGFLRIVCSVLHISRAIALGESSDKYLFESIFQTLKGKERTVSLPFLLSDLGAIVRL